MYLGVCGDTMAGFQLTSAEREDPEGTYPLFQNGVWSRKFEDSLVFLGDVCIEKMTYSPEETLIICHSHIYFLYNYIILKYIMQKSRHYVSI